MKLAQRAAVLQAMAKEGAAIEVATGGGANASRELERLLDKVDQAAKSGKVDYQRALSDVAKRDPVVAGQAAARAAGNKTSGRDGDASNHLDTVQIRGRSGTLLTRRRIQRESPCPGRMLKPSLIGLTRYSIEARVRDQTTFKEITGKVRTSTSPV